MKNKFFVYLPIEVGSRDLDHRLLLGLELVKKGFGIVLIDDKILNSIIKNLPASVIFDKSFTRIIYQARLSLAAQNGWLTSAIDEEGFLTNKDKRILGRYSDKVSNIIDIAFFWSDFHQKEVANFTQNQAWQDRGFATGSSRLDLLGASGAQFYRLLQGELKNLFGNYILINTNFTCNGNRTPDELLIISKQAGETQSRTDEKEFLDLLHYEEEIMSEFLDRIDTIARAENNLFIIRPHPGEKIQSYYERFSNNQNINIIRAGSAESWIHNSRVVYGHHCTTLLQSVLAKKQVHNFRTKNKQLKSNRHYTDRPSFFLSDYNTDQSPENKKTVMKLISNIWKLPRENTNASEIANVIYEKSIESKGLKSYSSTDVTSFLRKLKLHNYSNPKVGPSTFSNAIEKVDAMKKSFGLDIDIQSVTSIPNAAIIIE